MADLGMDSGSLRLKVMEKELLISEQAVAKKRVILENERLHERIRTYNKSLRDLDTQLIANQSDLDALKHAYELALSEETNNG